MFLYVFFYLQNKCSLFLTSLFTNELKISNEIAQYTAMDNYKSNMISSYIVSQMLPYSQLVSCIAFFLLLLFKIVFFHFTCCDTVFKYSHQCTNSYLGKHLVYIKSYSFSFLILLLVV